MIGSRQIARVCRGLSPPGADAVVSLYASVNELQARAHPNTIRLRARAALRELDAPGRLQTKAEDDLMSLMPYAGTLIAFSSEDGLQSIRLPLQLDLPRPAGVAARYGHAYLTPFLYALDAHQRQVVALVGPEGIRALELFLGRVHDLGKGRDAAVSGDALCSLCSRRRIGRVLLLGDEDAVLPLRLLMRRELPGVEVHHAPAPVRWGAPSRDVVVSVAPVLAQLREERQARVLAGVEQRGLVGPRSCLGAAREGRVETLVVPWPTRFSDRLPELALSTGTAVEFVDGEARKPLEARLGGMAAFRAG